MPCIGLKFREREVFSFAKPCLAWSHELGATDTEKPCPYCDLEKGRLNITYYMNAIDREAQSKYTDGGKLTKEEKNTGFKELDSASTTPVVVMRFPTTVSAKLQERGETNIHKVKTKDGKVIKKAFDISHVRFGRDISLKFDRKKEGANMYEIERAEHTPLTEEELDYLIWDIEDVLEQEDPKSASAEAARISKMHHKTDDAEEAETEEETYDAEEARNPKKGRKQAPVVDEDEDAFDEDEDEDEEEEAPPKKASRKKHKVVEEESEEEEEAPSPKRKRRSKPESAEEEFDEDDIPF